LRRRDSHSELYKPTFGGNVLTCRIAVATHATTARFMTCICDDSPEKCGATAGAHVSKRASRSVRDAMDSKRYTRTNALFMHDVYRTGPADSFLHVAEAMRVAIARGEPGPQVFGVVTFVA
jgi:hypothetical protein